MHTIGLPRRQFVYRFIRIYNILLIIAVLLFGGECDSILANEYSTHLKIGLFPSKEVALKETRLVVVEINESRHKIAQAESKRVCPLENNPKFKVKRIQILSYNLSDSNVGGDVQYESHIEYEISCKNKNKPIFKH